MRRLFVISLACLPLLLAVPAHAGPHYDKAHELYAKGPDAAPDVLRELELELKDNPESEEALLLKGAMLRGIREFEASQEALGQLMAVQEKKGVINPGVLVLRLENYGFMGDYISAAREASIYWAFLQDDSDIKLRSEDISNFAVPRTIMVAFALDHFMTARETPLKGRTIAIVEGHSIKALKSDSKIGASLESALVNGDDTVAVLFGGPAQAVFFKEGRPRAYMDAEGKRAQLDEAAATMDMPRLETLLNNLDVKFGYAELDNKQMILSYGINAEPVPQ